MKAWRGSGVAQSSGVARSSAGLVNYVAWVVLHRKRHIGANERGQLIPHVRCEVPFLEPENPSSSGFIYAGLFCSVTGRQGKRE